MGKKKNKKENEEIASGPNVDMESLSAKIIADLEAKGLLRTPKKRARPFNSAILIKTPNGTEFRKSGMFLDAAIVGGEKGRQGRHVILGIEHIETEGKHYKVTFHNNITGEDIILMDIELTDELMEKLPSPEEN